MPKRPSKKWFKRCVKKVAKTSVISPEAVCGSLWYHKMSPAAKRRVIREERSRNPNKELFMSKRNPGAMWHAKLVERYDNASKINTRSAVDRAFDKGQAFAHKISELESLKMGINPKSTRLSKLLFLTVKLLLEHDNAEKIFDMLKHKYKLTARISEYLTNQAMSIVSGKTKYVSPEVHSLLKKYQRD